jgi:hypothetical protein
METNPRNADGVAVFNYVASVQGHEFIVTLFNDRRSEWEALTGKSLADQLQTPVPEPEVEVPISDQIFAKAMAMAEKEKLEEAQTGTFQVPAGETADDIAELDRLMTSFFWNEVNGRLKEPLIRDEQGE